MSARGLGNRAIIGSFFKTLEQDEGAEWVAPLSMLFTSDQASEEYKWLGQTAQMREWVGGRQAKGFRENGLIVDNKHFEGSIEVDVSELRRDKTGQVMVRINELAQRANAHWAKILTDLILNGDSTPCYDGQFFFDTDHTEGNNQTNQSNDLSIDISALPTEVHGAAVTAPSVEEFQLAVSQAVQQIMSFLDDQSEPMNENARSFGVMVPTSLMHTAVNGLVNPMAGPAQTNLDQLRRQFSITPYINARLNGQWTDKFAVFRLDGQVKPFIRQEETPIDLKVIAEGSELEFQHDKHWYGVDTWRNVAYGYWQHACLVTLT